MAAGDPRTSSSGLLAAVILIGVVSAALHIVAAQPELSWMWGAHFYAFFPPALLWVATLLLAVSIITITRRRESIAAAVTRLLGRRLAGRRRFLFVSALVVAATALFWIARICHTYLGDGNVIVQEIDTRRELLEREPLTSLLQYAVYHLARGRFFLPGRNVEDAAQDTVATGSVTAGFFFLIATWFLAGEIARLRSARVKLVAGGVEDREAEERRSAAFLVWAVLVLQGYIQLFFGYVENYSFHAVGVVIYLWLSLRYLRDASPLLLPALALLLCFALHMSSPVLGIPFAVLAVAAVADRARRGRAIRDLALTVAAALAVGLVFSRLRDGYNPLATLRDMTRTAFHTRGGMGYMFSGMHYRDFFNEQILIGPLGMFLFLAGAAVSLTGGTRRSLLNVFFLTAGASFVAACWMIRDSNLGYARDWDLLSHSGIVFTVAGLALFFSPRTKHSVAVAALLCAALVSLHHTAPWIATNANADRSLARLKTLPLGRGRTEVVLSNWYRRHGDETQQREWLERAVEHYPNEVNAYYLLGAMDYGAQRYAEAIPSFTKAVSLRPDKEQFRDLLVACLYYCNRMPEAIPHLEAELRHQPDDPPTLALYGEALHQAGRAAEANRAFARAEVGYRRLVGERPASSELLARYGWILYRLGRSDEARETLTRAMTIEPVARDAPCYLGYVLRDSGRNSEAAEVFRTCVDVNPTFPGRQEIIAWLGTAPQK